MKVATGRGNDTTPEVRMSYGSQTTPVPTTGLTAAERDWIRRQGLTARALDDKRQRVRDRLASKDPVERAREQLRRVPARFAR